MPDAGLLGDFHFLRPLWLLALLPTLALWLLVGRRDDADRQWRRLIAPHLLAHLKVGGESGWRFRPLHLIVVMVMLGAVGAAGPTWERERSPFAEDVAPLVIVVDVSRSMNAVDVQPTRLERAKQKVRDLLALRAGARTALVAYAGTAHTVLPLCDDATVFEAFVDALATDVMPVAGKEPSRALALAAKMLADDPVPGSVLFLTDGIGEEHADAFAEHAAEADDAILVLAVGTREGGPIRTADGRFETDAGGGRAVASLDLEGLEALRERAGVYVTGVTVDDADVGRVQRRVQSHLLQVQGQDETARWRDDGWWLVLPVALLGLLWFRRGWTIRWGSALMLMPMLPVLLAGCGPASSGDLDLADLWLTPDQQGRLQFDRGEYAAAAERFQDPAWKGAALYRAGDVEGAVAWLGQVTTPEAAFNLGNAYARLGDYEPAVAAYGEALASRPDWVEPRENRDLIQAILDAQQEAAAEEPPPTGEPSFDPDEVEFDEKGKKGKRGEVDVAKLTDEQLAEMWMRRLQTTPADFLRRRFASEAVGKGEKGAP